MSGPARLAATLAAALAAVGAGTRWLMFGGSGVCVLGGLLAMVEDPTPTALGLAGIIAAAAGFVTSAGTFLLGIMRLRFAVWKVGQEQARRDSATLEELTEAKLRLNWNDAQLKLAHDQAELKDARIADLEREVVENRLYQNQTRARVHPPLPEIPDGPVDRRLSESGQFPVVPEARD